MHNTQDDRGDDRYHERDGEVINYNFDLIVPVVASHNDGSIFFGEITWELGTFHAVNLCKITAVYVRGVSAPLDVNEKDGFVREWIRIQRRRVFRRRRSGR